MAPSFSALTFNVMVGTPIPRPFAFEDVPLLGSPAGAPRLERQLEAVRAAGADLVGLQELHDCRVTRGYGAAFAASHVLVTGSHFNARGECSVRERAR